MKTHNAAGLWRDIEEHLTPAFHLWASDRVVYFYLARVIRLAGHRTRLLPARTIARATLLGRSTVRIVLRRLAARGVLRVTARSYCGLRITLKLPREIPGCIQPRVWDGRRLDALDFWTSRNRRAAIHRRDGHRCFYCRRPLPPHQGVLDHVVPRVRHGRNSYRNLVACCPDCNILKRDRPAADLLRRLHRDGLLTPAELRARTTALRLLSDGRLRPSLPLPRQARK
jgi:hypothetical protein